MLSTTKRQRGLAALVTVGGALAIWTLSMVRQQGDDRAASRQWVGEQWDVARQCLVGTPIGRGEGEVAIGRRMEAELYDALIEAALQDEPDLDTLWPARCLPRLASLHRDPEIFRQSPENALAQVEVLAPRVLRPARGLPYGVEDRLERIGELAVAVAALDEAMPIGAEYEHEDFPPPRLDPADVAASMTCRTPMTSRPFLQPDVLDALEGEVSWRLAEDEGRFTRTVSGPLGTRELELEVHGTVARFMNLDGEVGWLNPDTRTLTWGERAWSVAGVPPNGFAPCFSEGQTAHVAWSTAEGIAWSALPAEAGELRPVPVEPTPARTGTRVACNDTDAVFSWFEGDRWQVVRCHAETCRSLPPLVAQGDLQLAVGPAGVVASWTAPRSDLPVMRIAPTSDAWGEPRLGLRGRLTGNAEGYRVETCTGPRVSRDGLRWRAPE